MTKIEQLKIEYERKAYIAGLEDQVTLSTFKYICDSKKPFAVFNADTREQVAEVLNTYPPIVTQFEVDHGSDHYVIESPYQLHLNNGARGDTAVKIQYAQKDYDIWIEFPDSIIDNLLGHYERSITDSEYHYFIGLTHSQLAQRKTRARTFGQELSYYGGSKVCNNEDVIDRIINFILTGVQ